MRSERHGAWLPMLEARLSAVDKAAHFLRVSLFNCLLVLPLGKQRNRVLQKTDRQMDSLMRLRLHLFNRNC